MSEPTPTDLPRYTWEGVHVTIDGTRQRVIFTRGSVGALHEGNGQAIVRLKGPMPNRLFLEGTYEEWRTRIFSLPEREPDRLWIAAPQLLGSAKAARALLRRWVGGGTFDPDEGARVLANLHQAISVVYPEQQEDALAAGGKG